MIETVGEVMYVISLLASLAIAWRMFLIWLAWGTELAAKSMALSLIFAGYWAFCIIRLHLGCLGPMPFVDAWICGEMAWWTRMVVAATLATVAIWVWKQK